MPPSSALLTLAALVLLAVAVGVAQRVFTGRLRRAAGEPLHAADLGTTAAFGSRATLVQFSTPTCAICPSTGRLLRGIADDHPGVVHLEVDLAQHPAVADRFRVLQTPTTLVVDAQHRVRVRIGGAPRPEALKQELITVLGGSDAR